MFYKICIREGCNNTIPFRWKYQQQKQKYCCHKCSLLDRIGKKHSEKTIDKMRHPHKKRREYTVWNKGLTKETDSRVRRGAENIRRAKVDKLYSSWAAGRTRETDHRIDDIAKKKEGKSRSDYTKEKISSKLRGRNIPRDVIEKLRTSLKRSFSSGERSPWNKGLTKESNDSLREMAERKKGRSLVLSEASKKSKSEKLRSHHPSLETRQKMSEIRIKNLLKNKSRFKWFNTKPELEMKNLLKRYGLNFIHQKKVGKYIFDFYIPKFNLLIEVDGVYHHGKYVPSSGVYSEVQKKIMKRDVEKTELAKERNFVLVRVWSDEISTFEKHIQDNLHSETWKFH